MPPRCCVLVALIGWALLQPDRATAQTIRIGALRAESAVDLEIRDETIRLSCQESGERDLSCHVRASWTLHNTGSDVVEPRLRISWSGEPTDVVVRAGQAILSRELPKLRPASLVVAPDVDVVFEIEATVNLHEYLGTSPNRGQKADIADGLFARHPFLATRWEIRHLGLVWVGASTLSFSHVGATAFELALPEGWEYRFDANQTAQSTESGVRFESREDRPPQELFGLDLSKAIHTEILRHGGPYLALGGTIDRGFRAGLGYEVGLGEWFIFSFSGDTDFEQQGVITPMLEAATNALTPLPSVAFGLGAPIQLEPYLLGGVRFQLSVTFFFVGVVAMVDYWPEDSVAQFSILGRVGL